MLFSDDTSLSSQPQQVNLNAVPKNSLDSQPSDAEDEKIDLKTEYDNELKSSLHSDIDMSESQGQGSST